MNEIVSNLLVYGSLPEDSILWQLADICEKLMYALLRSGVAGQAEGE